MRSLSLAILVDFLKTQRFRESSLRLRQYTIRYSFFFNCINIAKVSFYSNIYTFIIYQWMIDVGVDSQVV